MEKMRIKGISYALLAAVLFGASTPLAKLFLETTSPFLLAGLLYLGSGIGLSLWTLFSHFFKSGLQQPGLARGEWRWFLGAAVPGGVIAPVLLMFGLSHVNASSAALLLNLEAVATTFIAWLVFKENVSRNVFVGFILITGGACVLSWPQNNVWEFSWGVPAIALACLCWGIDNNMTRKISACDPVLIAKWKGFIAGSINILMALALTAQWPASGVIVKVGVIGFLGYGLSLVLFILALRHLGTARTGAYFSTAPFAGAILALYFWPQTFSGPFVIAGILMAVGVWLHLTEDHHHEHIHEPLSHEHLHVHDEHHQHEHTHEDPPGEPHSHWHVHQRLVHSHRHDPDIHHQHPH